MTKKQTKKQDAPANAGGTTISNCQFHAGVKWDPAALETLDKVAQGLLNLTKLFTGSHVTVKTMVTIGNTTEPTTLKDSVFVAAEETP